jgi:hypothetical protein
VPLRNLPGVPGKQNEGASRARGFKRSRAQNGVVVENGESYVTGPVMSIESGGEVQILPRLRPRSHDHAVGQENPESAGDGE